MQVLGERAARAGEKTADAMAALRRQVERAMRRMLTYAHVCSRMRTYAGRAAQDRARCCAVGRAGIHFTCFTRTRMLTYADVC